MRLPFADSSLGENELSYAPMTSLPTTPPRGRLSAPNWNSFSLHCGTVSGVQTDRGTGSGEETPQFRPSEWRPSCMPRYRGKLPKGQSASSLIGMAKGREKKSLLFLSFFQLPHAPVKNLRRKTTSLSSCFPFFRKRRKREREKCVCMLQEVLEEERAIHEDLYLRTYTDRYTGCIGSGRY